MMSIIKLAWLQVPECYFVQIAVVIQEFMFYLGTCDHLLVTPLMISMYAMNLPFSFVNARHLACRPAIA